MNQQQASRAITQTMIVHKLFPNHYPDLEDLKSAIIDLLPSEARVWLNRTKRESLIEKAWYQAWVDADDQLALQEVGVEEYLSEEPEEEPSERGTSLYGMSNLAADFFAKRRRQLSNNDSN